MTLQREETFTLDFQLIISFLQCFVERDGLRTSLLLLVLLIHDCL